jgi:hypothetical protein
MLNFFLGMMTGLLISAMAVYVLFHAYLYALANPPEDFEEH